MPPKPSHDVADSLVAAAPLVSRWIQRLLGRHQPPLSVGQFLALRAISQDEPTAAELAERAGVSGSAVSQLTAELEQAGWIRRAPVPDDRRRQVLALSTRGESVLSSAAALLREELGALLGAIPQREAEGLARSLGHIERAFGGSPPPRRPPPPRPKHRRPPGR